MKKINSFILILLSCIVISTMQSVAQLTGKQKIDSLLLVLKIQKEDTSYVISLNELANELRKDNPDSAIYYADKALLMATKLRYTIGMANSYSYLGIAKNNQGKPEEALKTQGKALKLYAELDHTGGRAKTYLNIGNIYLSQGNYPSALKNYYTSMSLYEKIKSKRGMAGAFLNIAIIYKNQNNYDEAMKNFLASLALGKETNDKNIIFSAYDGMATIEIVKLNYGKALEYQHIVLEIVTLTGNRGGMSRIYNNIGLNYYNQGKYDEALENYFKSLKIKIEINDVFGSASTYGNIGNVYTKQKKFVEAGDYLNKGLLIAKEYQSTTELRNIYAHLEELYRLKDNYKEAHKYLQLYIDYRDSLLNNENTKKIVQAQMQYEFDKKEASTKAEQEKKDVIAQQEIQKQKLIRNGTFGGVGIAGIFSFFLVLSYNKRKKTSFEKQVSEVEMTALRSQMNPHFIFNSLHSINNYMMSNDKRSASDYLGKFSKLMRLILENSREQEVPLEKDLLTLELYIELEMMRFENKFSFKIEVDDALDPENTLIPPMILQPFVENSILHGLQHKAGDGRILIKIKKENDMLVCIVEDNGVGRHKALEMKKTTATHKGESLGMKITNARIDIINKIKKSNASVNLIDLSEGMRAEVTLPYELAF